MDAISLDEYIKRRVYYKNETYTQEEVINAINNLILVKVVPSLPTENIRNNQLYLIVNDANLSEEEHNRYDLYIYVNGEWEQIDSLEFKISDYPTKTETDYALTFKSDVGHGHDLVSVTDKSDGFISWEQQEKLDGIEEGANKVELDTTPTLDSNNAITSGSVYSALSGKAPVNHRSKNNTYGMANYEYYGHTKAGISVPPMNNGNGSVGTDNGLYARADHTHPTDTSRASTSSATTSSAGLMTAQMVSDLNNVKNSLNGVDFTDFITEDDVEDMLEGWDLGFTTIEDTVVEGSSNPVKSSGIKSYVDNAISNVTFSDEDLLEKLNDLVTEMKTI